MKEDFRTQRDQTWLRIEEENRRDLVVRRISFIAWGVTFFVLLVFTALVAVEFVHTLELQRVGVASRETVIVTIMPLLTVFGVVSLLVAIVSTIGVFLRLRTASLNEIQLRLAALEEIILEQSERD